MHQRGDLNIEMDRIQVEDLISFFEQNEEEFNFL